MPRSVPQCRLGGHKAAQLLTKALLAAGRRRGGGADTPRPGRARQPVRTHCWIAVSQVKRAAHMSEVWHEVRHWPLTGSQV